MTCTCRTAPLPEPDLTAVTDHIGRPRAAAAAARHISLGISL